MFEDDYRLRKKIEQHMRIMPLAKLAPKERYGIVLAFKITKDGESRKDLLSWTVGKPVDYHQEVKNMVDNFRRIESEFEEVEIIKYQSLGSAGIKIGEN